MTISASPPISLTDVMTEIRTRSPMRAYPLNLGDAEVRVIAGIPTGAVSLSNLLGKRYYIPMTINSSNGFGVADSSLGGGTVAGNPSVAVGDGDPPYSYLWSFTSNPDGCALTFATAATCEVSIAYAFNTNGSTNPVLQCQVTDNTGNVQTKTAILCPLLWDNGA